MARDSDRGRERNACGAAAEKSGGKPPHSKPAAWQRVCETGDFYAIDVA
jgi:hypothetical protein